MPFSFGEEPINTGDFATIQCSVHKGDLPIKISWLLNNETVDHYGGIIVSKVGSKISTITIDSVQENQAGEYTCIAENRAGKTHFGVILNVNGILNFLCYTVDCLFSSVPIFLFHDKFLLILSFDYIQKAGTTKSLGRKNSDFAASFLKKNQ